MCVVIGRRKRRRRRSSEVNRDRIAIMHGTVVAAHIPSTNITYPAYWYVFVCACSCLSVCARVCPEYLCWIAHVYASERGRYHRHPRPCHPWSRWYVFLFIGTNPHVPSRRHRPSVDVVCTRTQAPLRDFIFRRYIMRYLPTTVLEYIYILYT